MPQRSEGPGTEYPVIRAAVSLLLAILLLNHLPAGAEPKDDAEALRFFLESHYSISVRMGDECRVETSESFQTIITPEGNTAFQQLVYGNRRFQNLLQLLENALSVYPPDFFSGFQWTRNYGGLIILLVDGIQKDGIPRGGFQSGADADGKIRIFLSRTGAKESTIHHEIGHAVDYRIRWQDSDAFNDWYRLNPEGFLYTGDFSGTGDADKESDDWFVREYSKIDEYEDRATLFEALMTKPNTWWESRPYLRKKAEAFLEKVRPVFGKLRHRFPLT